MGLRLDGRRGLVAGGNSDIATNYAAHPEAVGGKFRRLDETWGGLDILVNNAGVDGARRLVM